MSHSRLDPVSQLDALMGLHVLSDLPSQPSAESSPIDRSPIIQASLSPQIYEHIAPEAFTPYVQMTSLFEGHRDVSLPAPQHLNISGLSFHPTQQSLMTVHNTNTHLTPFAPIPSISPITHHHQTIPSFSQPQFTDHPLTAMCESSMPSNLHAQYPPSSPLADAGSPASLVQPYHGVSTPGTSQHLDDHLFYTSFPSGRSSVSLLRTPTLSLTSDGSAMPPAEHSRDSSAPGYLTTPAVTSALLYDSKSSLSSLTLSGSAGSSSQPSSQSSWPSLQHPLSAVPSARYMRVRVPQTMQVSRVQPRSHTVEFSVNAARGVRVKDILKGRVAIADGDDRVLGSTGARKIRLVIAWPGYTHCGTYIPVQSETGIITRQALVELTCAHINRFFREASKSHIAQGYERWAIGKRIYLDRLFLLAVAPAGGNVWLAELEVNP